MDRLVLQPDGPEPVSSLSTNVCFQRGIAWNFEWPATPGSSSARRASNSRRPPTISKRLIPGWQLNAPGVLFCIKTAASKSMRRWSDFAEVRILRDAVTNRLLCRKCPLAFERLLQGSGNFVFPGGR
ncbi:hypothetical protein LMG23994_06352 [Cupriavidus pinatubonensis]|uniref:Uncharacterized protein n=1 Tax=Cupriavidus pinatubonensis TaxID=248026 RepID=A0ABM8Y1V2_9BURK|nr:hypothetical protein LMG23994_06352 [Cupriavidus pinatubonensis]